MSYEITVLRAVFRISRRRAHAAIEDILVRVEGDETDVRVALARLARAGLVERTAEGPRLTLAGLAIAAACAAPVGPRKAATSATNAKARANAAGAAARPTQTRQAGMARRSTDKIETVERLPARVIPIARRHRAA